jgi:subtilisin family serine protease
LSGTSKYRFFPSGIAADTASYFTTDGAFNFTTWVGVTVSAPGENQENVTKAGKIQSVGILSTKLGGGTVQMSGTSMSAPHVAGVIARAVEADPGADPETIRALIMENALLPGAAPYDSPTSSYSFDGQREGIVSVPELWVGP